METPGSYDAWIGRTAVDANGDKIGEIKDIFYDDVTGRPEWVAVKTGLLGGQSIAPINGATIMEHTDADTEADLRLAYTKDQIKQAPDIDTDTDATEDASGYIDDRVHLSVEDERELYEHYGFAHTGTDATTTYGQEYGKLRPDVDYKAARYDREHGQWRDAGEVTAEATATSESVQKVEGTETVRLRKYRRTEMVPVTKEEIRVETTGSDPQQPGSVQRSRPS